MHLNVGAGGQVKSDQIAVVIHDRVLPPADSTDVHIKMMRNKSDPRCVQLMNPTLAIRDDESGGAEWRRWKRGSPTWSIRNVYSDLDPAALHKVVNAMIAAGAYYQETLKETNVYSTETENLQLRFPWRSTA